ncbi:CHY zinc finger protein [Agromyces sp. LHK192]|uniref:CHY zinc finger protein n=1 Tax=Agromyces sp. LHK192 TaxID=2498704 RepID=UPI000FD727F6|nr:CHY zinc finger protein [Agromyces sp. LHK192]
MSDAAPRSAPRPRVLGPTVDDQTRCIHYRTPLDVVAIRFACCGEYYPCHACHAETAGHEARQWPRARRGERAILCGVCGCELTIDEYLATDACTRCGAPFNPGCALHADRYFEV